MIYFNFFRGVAARIGLGIALGCSIAVAQDEPKAPRPFDHGDDPNVELFTYKKLSQVPEVVPDRPLAKFELKDKIYHGVLINTDTQEGFDKIYARYVDIAGKKPTMIGCFAPMWSKGIELPPETFLKRLKVIDTKPNVIPFIKLSTSDWVTTGPFLKADDILAGKEDARFQKLAQFSQQFGKPFLLSINHEMNGDWFAYSELFKKQPTDWTADKFKQVWQRIHGIFQKEGATNVAFAWCPGAIGRKFGKYDSMNSYKAYYPGDEYVDWVGASFYNDVNHYALDILAANYPNKPIVLAEWGTEPKRGDWYIPKPYIGDAPHVQKTFDFVVNRYPNMKAVTWFYWGKNCDIERVPEQIPIYREGIANPKFYNNE